MRRIPFAPCSLPAVLLMLAAGLPAHAVPTATCQAGNPVANVSQSTPTSDFTDHGNGTVTHAKTGLMWRQCAEGLSGAGCSTGTATVMDWASALQASTAAFAGHADWRLPNKKELESIIEFCGYSPSINRMAFPATPLSRSQYFWSSSSYSQYPSESWVISFYDGKSLDFTKGAIHYVRLVRGGQSVDVFDALNPTISTVPGLVPVINLLLFQ